MGFIFVVYANKNLYALIPTRVRGVRQARGYITKYLDNTLFLHFSDLSKKNWIFFCSFMHISIYLCNPNSTKNMFYYWKLFLINKIATVIVRILLPKVCTKETPSNSHLNLDTQSNGIILIKILILSGKTVETSAVAATKTPQLHHFF